MDHENLKKETKKRKRKRMVNQSAERKGLPFWAENVKLSTVHEVLEEQKLLDELREYKQKFCKGNDRKFKNRQDYEYYVFPEIDKRLSTTKTHIIHNWIDITTRLEPPRRIYPNIARILLLEAKKIDESIDVEKYIFVETDGVEAFEISKFITKLKMNVNYHMSTPREEFFDNILQCFDEILKRLKKIGEY